MVANMFSNLSSPNYFSAATSLILSPRLLNIFINDILLFLPKCDLANYADNSTIYTSDKRVSRITDSLSHQFTVTSWFLTQIDDLL